MNNIKTKLTQNNNQRIVLFQLVISILILFNTLISCSNSSKISQVNKKQIIGVQLADGQVVTAQTTKVNDRSDRTIYNFMEKWMYLSYNWSTEDLKVEIEESKIKVPGNVYASTYPITTRQDFRASYTKEFANLIAKASKGQPMQSAIDIRYISEKPTKIKNGLWEVIVISEWTGLNEKGTQIFQIPVSKRIRLKPIPIAGKPTFTGLEGLTQLQKIINEINQYGLEIVSIDSYDPE